MQSISAHHPDRHFSQLFGGTLLSAGLAVTGLSLAFLTIGTPFISRLVPADLAGTSQVTIGMVVWSLAIIAGAALLVAGTTRLASTIVTARSRPARRSLVMRAMGELPDDIDIVTGVVARDGRPTPELVVGPFGVAVVKEMRGPDRIRRVAGSWEAWTERGWMPTEDPLDRVARDAEAVRRWLTQGDLDFVVRVHAALVTADGLTPRTPLCAVITAQQIPAWLAALPRQRTLSAGRRDHLLARVRQAVVDEARRGGW
jgi:hypothetical protein